MNLRFSKIQILFCLIAFPFLMHADTFYYDTAGRLYSVVQSNGLTHSYSYDQEANMLSASHTGTSTSGNGIPDWWQYFYFGTNTVDPMGDPTNDGISNLMKYALGLNPTVAESGPLVDMSLQVYTDGQTYPYLSYIFSEDAAMTLQIQMEQSVDLLTWESQVSSLDVVGATDLGNGTEQIILRSLTPVTGSPKLFFRLQVTAP